MNHWITVFNNLFKSNPKINNLEIVLESDGELSTPPSSHYTPINDKLQISFLEPVSNTSLSNSTKQSTASTTSTTSITSTTSTTSNYKPPSKTLPTSTKTPEESPFSKFRIWGQKS